VHISLLPSFSCKSQRNNSCDFRSRHQVWNVFVFHVIKLRCINLLDLHYFFFSCDSRLRSINLLDMYFVSFHVIRLRSINININIATSFIRSWSNQSTTTRFGHGEFDMKNATKVCWFIAFNFVFQITNLTLHVKYKYILIKILFHIMYII